MSKRFIAAATLALASAGLTSPALAQARVSPVIVPPADAPSPLLIARDAAVRCAGRRVEPIYAERLSPRVLPMSSAFDREPSTQTLRFAINEEGRPRSIRPLPAAQRPNPTEDDQATLAAYRFAPGRAQADCTMTISLTPRPLAEASREQLAFAYAVDRAWPASVVRALARPGDDCRTRPRPDVAVYPSPDAGRIPPGGLGWSVTRWNVTRDGRTSDVETLASSGDAELDAEIRRVVVASTFQPDAPRRGCIGAWTRQGATLSDTPEPEPTGDPLKNCPAELRARFTHARLTYPTAFQRRGIEGWAIVRYDIASWGEPGAIEVLEAQPAAAFGEAARNIVRAGRATPGHVAGIRCTDRVIFRLPQGDEQPNID